ncbi:DUF3800 domain-containing protein [Pseudomonas brassicacearum]|uniref:DUF3800 domain-containing protein n=1 Tax=Pseudomonas brassicacearum TaxID=930166 RepID=UPI0009B8F238|nr:DUF3800 domain-containing protein [Pseudomonas brassicacearum]
MGDVYTIEDSVPLPPAESPQKTIKKQLTKYEKIDKEKKELLSSLAAADFSTLKPRVASVLNLYPHTRNSDISLSLKYWEIFQRDIYNESGILPKDLFRLERLHYIVRARAKIQNEYGLFLADSEIKKSRRKNEEKMEGAVLEDSAPRKTVHIFSDETGKTHRFVIVASVWVLSGRAVFTISKAINEWQAQSVWKNREVHFSKFGKSDYETLKGYLTVILENREYLGFKVIAVERAKTNRSIEETILKLHEHMLIRGATHEVKSGRMDLPREMDVTVDEEQSLDSFVIADLRERVSINYKGQFDDTLQLRSLQTASSKNSQLVQLSDVIAGAIGRILNHEGERNFKDDMAELVAQMLDLKLDEENIDGLDSSALFNV